MDLERRDSGSIVLGWLTKLIVAIAIVGVALFDTISVAAARLGATDDASTAAEAAVAAYHSSHNVQEAYQAAVETLPSDTESLPPRQFVVQPDGSVNLVLRRTTTTLVAHRIGPLKKYAVVVVHGEATQPAP
jgi:type II secretory pathway pseudopilin PulG